MRLLDKAFQCKMTVYLVRKKIMMPDITAMPMNFSLLLQNHLRTSLIAL